MQAINSLPFSVWYFFCVYYSGEQNIFTENLKWIWIFDSLYYKIRVNNKSHRFVFIKPQDLFGISKNAFSLKFWPFYFVFIFERNTEFAYLATSI